MANQYGFTSVNQQVTSGGNTQQELLSKINEVNEKLIYARVTDIILDETHPNFDEYGQWASIGSIFFEPTEGGSFNYQRNPQAFPLFPNQKNYPVVNEVVLLFLLPNKGIIDQINNTSYYYINPISIWNHPNLNAYPNIYNNPQVQDSQNKSYQAIEDGQTRKPSDEEINYDYNSPLIGGTFTPNGEIRPLLSFAGDVITEGRWGNSIRFGSTTSGATSNFTGSLLSTNNWSSNGDSGEPIIIIRNGQPTPELTDEGWLPIVENINNDQSSIYLTSNQEIPLQPSVLNNPSVKALPPQKIPTYQGSQIMLNSDRLVFNTKADSIILNSQQSVSIASKGPIGLYSQNNDIVLQTSRKNVRLGDSQANQPVIKGDSFLRDFEILLKRLEKLSEKLTGEPYLKTSTLAAGSLNEQVSEMLNSIQSYKSKIVKIV